MLMPGNFNSLQYKPLECQMQSVFDAQDLIMSIYDAAMEPELWPAILDKVSDLADARGAFIFDISVSTQNPSVCATYHTSKYDSALVREYLRLFNKQELRDQKIFAEYSQLTDGIELIPDTVLGPTRAAIDQLPNAQMMAKYGISYRAGALLNKDHLYSDRFAMQFSRRAGLPTGERLQTIGMIMPHIAKALDMGRQTSRGIEAKHALLDTFNHLRIGICILSSKGGIVFRNLEFDRQIDAHRAFSLNAQGQLVANDPKVKADLDTLLSGVEHHGKFGARPRKEAVLHPLRQDEAALCIEVIPLFSGNIVGEAKLNGFVLFSLDTSQKYSVDTRYLGRMYSLTPSEEAVLAMIAEGMTNVQISERRNRSPETIYTQVKTLLSKTMTQNRTQLIRMATGFSPQVYVKSAITISGDDVVGTRA